VATSDDDTFLGRWSRRKHAARRGEALPEPVPEAKPAEPPPPAPAAAGPSADATPVELPPIDSLQGLESEYKAFLRPGVDSATRGAALKKLFSDPHFHFDRMDKLDIYVDDYTRPDPIPTAMLRLLNQARGLGLFDEERQTERPEGEAQATPTQPTAASADLPAPETPAEPTDALPADVAPKPTDA
jgi:hypothetical protein